MYTHYMLCLHNFFFPQYSEYWSVVTIFITSLDVNSCVFNLSGVHLNLSDYTQEVQRSI